MGFYGNITNTSRTQFSFDRTYPNRAAMDAVANSDGVMIGRYVLVDYDNKVVFPQTIDVYKDLVDNKPVFYLNRVYVEETTVDEEVIPAHYEFADRLKEGMKDAQDNLIDFNLIRVPGLDSLTDDNYYNYANPGAREDEFWSLSGTAVVLEDDVEVTYLTFDSIAASPAPYDVNYNIDKDIYHNARGYDSTAWQKTASGYVMVAELNSIVPSFGISADAPKMVPTPPHFDEDSTNIYYNLHMPAAWGFRVKAASSNTRVPIVDASGNQIGAEERFASSSDKNYLSDQEVTWTRELYDAETEEGTISSRQIQGAIYFNKAGLDPENIVYSNDNAEGFRGWGINGGFGDITDEITVEHTGYSGHQYNIHDSEDSIAQSPQIDTIEMAIMLPSLGNTVAKMWDLIYGGRNINSNDKRNLDIRWENARSLLQRKGLRLTPDAGSGQLGYAPEQVQTVAGVINSVHDLMGMIITPDTNAHLQDQIGYLSADRIYYDQTYHKYYRKKKVYDYSVYQYSQAENLTAEEFAEGTYYFKAGEVYIEAQEYDEDAIYYIRTEIPVQYTYTEATGVTADNFDPTLYFTQDINEDYQSADTYTAGETYYTRQLTNAERYDEITLTQFEPWKYWYKDYVGTYVDDHVDWKQDSEYDSSHSYYNNFSMAVQDSNLATYEAGKFYYVDAENNTLTLVRDNNSIATKRLDYYNLDINKVKSVARALQDANYTDATSYKLYVPGVYYYWNESTQDYVLANENAPLANTNYYAATIDQNAEDQIYYIITVTWSLEQTVLEEDFVANYYWMNKSYMPNDFDFEGYLVEGDYFRTKEWDEDNKTHYIIRNESLREVTTKPVVIDKQNPIHSSLFLSWFVDTFWKRLYNENNVLVGYQLLSRRDVTYADISDLDNIFVFYSGVATHNLMDIFDLRHFNDDGYTNYPSPLAIANGNEGIVNRTDYALSYQPEFYIPNYYYLRVPNENEYTYTNLNGDPVITYGYNLVYEQEDAGSKEAIDTEWNITGDARRLAKMENSDTEFILNYILLGNAGPDLVENKTFYEPNKYYYYNDTTDEYEKDLNNDLTVGRTYYTKTTGDYYVASDSSGAYEQGAQWNNNIENIPNTVTLSEKTERWTLVELPEFARGITTIHGMLLKIWKMLEFGDKNTRDLNTVQGMLNSMKDIFDKINSLTPGEVAIINNYGQIESGEVTGDEWITPTVDSTFGNTELNISHNEAHYSYSQSRGINDWRMRASTDEDPNHVGSHANNSINVTEDLNNLVATDDDYSGNGESIKLYLPNMDESGHVIGRVQKTVTLPYGFKNISASNSSTDSVYADPANAVTNSIIADSAQDTVGIQAGNKWIRLATDATNDALTIAHATLVPITSALAAIDQNTLVNNTINDTITVYEIDTDNAGHITHNQPKTITLPYGFKTIVDENNNNTSATNTQDTVIVIGDEWVTPTVGTKEISLSHEDAQTVDTTIGQGQAADQNEGINPTFGGTFNILSIDFDEKGHYVDSVNHLVTLPAPDLNTISNSANVVTSLSLTPSTGAFVQTASNLCDIALGTTYTSLLPAPQQGETDTRISINTTLGTAIATLEKNLSDLSNIYLTIDDAEDTYLSQMDAPRQFLTGSSIAGSYEVISDDPNEPNDTVDISYNELYSIITSLNNRIHELENKVATMDVVYHNVTVILDENFAEFTNDSFVGGQVLDGDSITISINITDLDVTIDDWYINNVAINNSNSLTYTFTPIGDDVVEIRFIADEYEIKYNGNGNTNAVDLNTLTQTKEYDVAVTTQQNTFTKNSETGQGYKVTFNANGGYTIPEPIYTTRTTTYVQDGWNINLPNGTHIGANESYEVNASATLYANWSSSFTDSAITLPASPVSPNELYFIGWYTEAEGGTKLGKAGVSYQPTSNITLYAHWSATDSATLTYISERGTVPSAVTVEPDTSITLPQINTIVSTTESGPYVRINGNQYGVQTVHTYTHDNWIIDNNLYPVNGSFVINDDVSATADWSHTSVQDDGIRLPSYQIINGITCTITYQGNGGTPSRNSDSGVAYFDRGPSMFAVVTPSQYAGRQYGAGTLYPLELAQGYQTTMEASSYRNNYQYSASITLPSASWDGYPRMVFDGWYDSNDTLIGYANEMYAGYKNSITLYAHWRDQ